MKNSFLVLLSIMLVGCATGGPSPEQKAADKQLVQEYFKNPHNDILVLVEAIPGHAEANIQCHFSGSILGSSSSTNSSFNTTTPFVKITPFGNAIDGLIQGYKSLPENQRAQALLSTYSVTPTMSIICQNQEPDGLNGSIYFNGKQVASDSASVEYGTVSLNFTVPIQDILKDVK